MQIFYCQSYTAKAIYRQFIRVQQYLKTMQIAQQEKACENCGNLFNLDKIDLHEAYCLRNIKKCLKCSCLVDINQQQAHDQQKHTNKQCQQCHKTIPPSQFQSHPSICPLKPSICQYCQNTYGLGQLARHKQSCGSRTRQCHTCHKLIMIKQLIQHEPKCQKRIEQRRVQERRQQQRRQEDRRQEVSQDGARNRARNQRLQSRERQISQNVRDKEKRKDSHNKNVFVPNNKLKPSHMIGPQPIRPMIDPVPISIRLAMKAKQLQRVPLRSKN